VAQRDAEERAELALLALHGLEEVLLEEGGEESLRDVLRGSASWVRRIRK
jgi:hypothetical protein